MPVVFFMCVSDDDLHLAYWFGGANPLEYITICISIWKHSYRWMIYICVFLHHVWDMQK